MGGATRRTVGELCGGMACVRPYVWGAVVVVWCLGSCMGGTVWECCVGRSYAWVGCAYRAVAQHCAGELCEGSCVEAVCVNCGGSCEGEL